MKWILVLAFIGSALADSEELPLAEICDEELCKLPECRCSSTSIPGGLSARDTPQVSLFFHFHHKRLSFLKTFHSVPNEEYNLQSLRNHFDFQINCLNFALVTYLSMN